MAVPNTASLAAILSALIGEAFAAEGLAPGFGAVRRSSRPDFGHFQCNGALEAARLAGRPPPELARAIVSRLENEPKIARIELAGPGFINIDMANAALELRLEEMRSDANCGGGKAEQPEKIILDFGGPNIAKPMHVGHLRSLIIGDCLQSLFRFLGHEVISDVHLGDWGLQMGLLVSEIAAEYGDEAWSASTLPLGMAELEQLYPRAAEAARNDPERMELARQTTTELQAGTEPYQTLWQRLVELTRSQLVDEFAALGICFDLWKGEADAAALLPEMFADLAERGLAIEDAGALIFPVERDDDNKPCPPLILRSSHGASGYQATDLATILDRRHNLAPDRIIYVVDQRQSLHFEQLFRAADKAGYMDLAALEHIGFGTMNDRNGKPFKTRDGGALKLGEFLAQARQAALERLDDLDENNAKTADQVAVAAIKFADLSNMRTTNYVFDLEQFLSFEGKTGPYLLYAAIRIKSLLRRARSEELTHCHRIFLSSLEEKALVLELDNFALVLSEAARKRMPHLICEHAYALAQSFSVFYTQLPIIKESDAQLRASRLGLSQLVLRQLSIALGLIGLKIPERM